MNRHLIYSLLFLFFTISFISCSKEYSSETGAFNTAKGSLQDISGNCYTSTIMGNYYKGVTLADSNYVILQVNVTTPGNYSIVTDTTNGFFFKDAGIFSSAGVKTIKLKASGKPVAKQSSDFIVSFDSTICYFTILVQDSTTTNPGGGGTYSSDTAWQFREGAKYFHGYIDTAFTFDTIVQSQSFKILQIQGSTALAGDSVFIIGNTFLGSTITTGTYTSNVSAVFRFLGSYNNSDSVYSSNFLTLGVNTTLVLSAYNTTTKIIQGTFSGTAKNKTGGIVTITAGKFEAKLN